MRRSLLEPGAPDRLARALTDRGPLFVKLGQFLALRPDLVPQETCDVLLGLTDHAPEFPFSEADRAFTEEFGAGLRDRLARVSLRPAAAGSMAQVHHGRMADGTAVAVKILRPGIERAALFDVTARNEAVRLLEAVVDGALPARLLVDEFSASVRDELDLRREAANLERLGALVARDRAVRLPRAISALSGRRVLTTTWLEGPTLSAVLRGAGPTTDTQRAVLARNLLTSVLDQILRHRFFHADTHPGNLIALHDQQIGMVDFGRCDALDPVFRRGMLGYLAAVYAGDVDGMYHALAELLLVDEASDLEGFRRDFLEDTRGWLRAREARRHTTGAPPVGDYLVRVLRLVRQHRLRIPSSMVSMYRALLTAERLATRLDEGRTDLLSVGEEVVRSIQVDEAVDAVQPSRLVATLVRLAAASTEGPAQAQRLLSDLSAGRFELPVRTSEGERDRATANDRARLTALGLCAVTLSGLAIAARGSRIGVVDLAILPAALAVGALLLMALVWRRIS